MDDELILKTRLAMDERPIRNLEKKINQWLYSLPTEAPETAQSIYESLLTQMANYQTSIERHRFIQQANNNDVDQYSNIVDKTGTKVVKTRNDISSLKDELVKAQKIRDNKLEYDKVALEIMKLQTREAYQQSIQQLKSDIEWLKNEKKNKDISLEERKNNLSGLIESAKKLQKTMEDERIQNRETQKQLMDMGHEYEDYSEDENENDDDDNEEEVLPDGSQVENKAIQNGTSHRFQERNEDEDEEGMVPNGDDEEKANVITNES
ncbi:hypothetical protein BJ944DRAFT_258139 [Cunninghamella echinulata]|nr:hypothetical protein BJ944DRAFT_258139 [Cunninghamella echinulata]